MEIVGVEALDLLDDRVQELVLKVISRINNTYDYFTNLLDWSLSKCIVKVG